MPEQNYVATSTRRMQFESLPNELLFFLFEYLTAIDLLQTLCHLNSRFDFLVLDHIRSHGFNFRSMSKNDFDKICRQHLPHMINKIPSLGLSDSDDTPGQIDRFYYHGFTLHQFIHLKSLSLHSIHSKKMMDSILSELCHLSSFARLTFEQCSFPNHSTTARSIINTIWSLSKLTHCSIDNDPDLEGRVVSPTVMSSSIRYFSIRGLQLYKNELNGLFERTPNLRHLSVNVQFDFPFDIRSSPVTSIRTLDMSVFQVNSTVLVDSLKQLPNLCRLKLSTSYCYMYGQQWEQLIKNHLPQLNTFQFRMKSAFEKEDNHEKHIDEILNSFRNAFWLHEHLWFVRCDWSPDYGKLFLYTVPYAFKDFSCEYSVVSKSTYPNKKNRHLYDSVHRLTYKPKLSQWSIRSQIQFFNIENLFIQFPISDYFYSMVARLDQLTSLDVSSKDRSPHSTVQLQALLDRAPNVSSLRYHIWPSSQMPPFESKSTSVYQLDLKYMNRCYNNEQCIALSRSPLGIQCEILSIAVENRECILNLVNTMDNLRTLNVGYHNDKNTWRIWSSTKDELMEKFHPNKTSRSTFDSDEYDSTSLMSALQLMESSS